MAMMMMRGKTHPTAASVDENRVSRLDFSHKMEKLVRRQPHLHDHDDHQYHYKYVSEEGETSGTQAACSKESFSGTGIR